MEQNNSNSDKQIDMSFKKRMLKLLLYISLLAVPICIFNFVKPVKLAFFDAGKAIEGLGWPGALIIIVIMAVVVPLGLPYIFCEMTVALLYSNYWIAVLICITAKMIGTTLCYVTGRTGLKPKIMYILKEQKLYNVYLALEQLVEENPLKYYCLFRGLGIPLFLKNFALAFPKKITFPLYFFAMIPFSLAYSMIQILIFRQFKDFLECVDEYNTEKIIYAVLLGVLSVGLAGYVLWQIKKRMAIMAIKKLDPSIVNVEILNDNVRESEKALETESEKDSEKEVIEKDSEEGSEKSSQGSP